MKSPHQPSKNLKLSANHISSAKKKVKLPNSKTKTKSKKNNNNQFALLVDFLFVSIFISNNSNRLGIVRIYLWHLCDAVSPNLLFFVLFYMVFLVVAFSSSAVVIPISRDQIPWQYIIITSFIYDFFYTFTCARGKDMIKN